MGILETVLNYKNQKEAQRNADLQAIPQAMMQFQAGRQQATDNLLKSLTLQASLASKGLKISENNGKYDISRDGSLISPADALKQQQVASQIGLNEKRGAMIDHKMTQPAQLPASRQNMKDKRTEDLFNTFETNKLRREQAKQVEDILPLLPKGLTGKAATEYMKNLKPDDPLLGGWQNMKELFSEIQLDKTARTKGSISDYEMKFFETSIGNDDLVSAPRLMPIIEKYKKGLEAKQRASVNSFKQMYQEDPSQWPELKPFFQNSGDSQTFNVGGKIYNIPADKVESFKKAKGIK